MYLCFNIEDQDWALDRCIDAVKTGSNADIKGLGLTCIGHIARQFGKVDKERVISFLNATLKDEILAGRAQDALDDIELFAK